MFSKRIKKIEEQVKITKTQAHQTKHRNCYSITGEGEYKSKLYRMLDTVYEEGYRGRS